MNGRTFRAHGTASAYNKGCRCAECREGNRERCAATRAALRRVAPGGVPHGAAGYSNYGCRCEVCTEANSARCRAYKLNRSTREG